VVKSKDLESSKGKSKKPLYRPEQVSRRLRLLYFMTMGT
jgi:hypothetical protein